MATDLVIILSSDWVGSTQARTDLGEDAADTVQEVHDTLLRRVIAAEGGTVVKRGGTRARSLARKRPGRRPAFASTPNQADRHQPDA